MASFQYGGGAPQFSDITFSDERKANEMGYADLLKGMGGMKGVFGGGGSGGGGGYQYGGGGGIGGGGQTLGGGGRGGMMGPGGSVMQHYRSSIRPIGGGAASFRNGAAGENWRLREAMPYETQLQQTQMQTQGQMDLAQLQGRIQLATAMAQIQAEREARMSLQIDNEKNRQLQLEMQRRNFGADDYQTKQQFHYQYGI